MTNLEPTASITAPPRAKPPFTIYFEDPHLIVFEKPAGLLSQSDHTQQSSVVDLLRIYFGRPYVGLIHRLDRNTAGVMIVAKRTKAARRLSESLIQGHLERTYQALLIGKLPTSSTPQLWRDHLLKDSKLNQMKIKKTSESQEAVLQLKILAQNSQLTHAEFKLETGRSHQIRIQCAHRGFPILGDFKYGGALMKSFQQQNKAWAPFFESSRLALISRSICFPHPITKQMLSFQSPWPKHLEQALK